MDDFLLLLIDHLLGGEPPMEKPQDILQLSAKQVLQIADQLPDEFLPAFVGLLKSQGEITSMFHQLMGEHEEELREISDRFFDRYANVVLQPDNAEEFNPLIEYIPPEMFHDLAVLQSRESFFTRQTIAVINEFLKTHFQDCPEFVAGQQLEAWNYFFSELLKV